MNKMKHKSNTNQKVSIKNIQLIIYDFDGVMTDNRVLTFQDGREAVFCNRIDGLAIVKIREKGIVQIIVSTEKNSVVRERAKKLKIPVLHSIDDKKDIVMKYCRKKKISLDRVVYVGNDFNDLEIMKLVAYPISPRDGAKEIKKIAKFVTKAKGGEGVIRELLDQLPI